MVQKWLQRAQLPPFDPHQMASQVDFVRRDGRLATRAVGELEVGLDDLLLDELDAVAPSALRSQLVRRVHTEALRAATRAAALRRMPWMLPLAHTASAVRRAQLAVSALLIMFVSLGVAPHAACGVACWGAQAGLALYSVLTVALVADSAIGTTAPSATSFVALCSPTTWASTMGLPAPLLRHLSLLALSVGALAVDPHLMLLAILDLLPAIPRCRAILVPLWRAAPPVLAVATLAAALAVPVTASLGAKSAAAGCAAGEVTACAVQALTTIVPASAAALVGGESGGGGGGADGRAAARFAPLVLLLALGALLLQLGIAMLVDALADARGRQQAARAYASEHCIVCGCTRASLDKLGPHAFARHVGTEHAPHLYVRLIASGAPRCPRLAPTLPTPSPYAAP